MRLCQSKEHLALANKQEKLAEPGVLLGWAWSLGRDSGHHRLDRRWHPWVLKKKKKSSETHRHADMHPAQISL